MNDSARILITRSQPGAGKLLRKLQRDGMEAFAFPLMGIKPRACPTVRHDVQAMVLTSAHASPVLPPRFDLPIYCVGASSGQSARALGFNVVHEGVGNAADLAQTLVRSIDPSKGPIMWFRGEDANMDWVRSVKDGGISIIDNIVYEARLVPKLSMSINLKLETGWFDAVTIQSARTARHFRALCPELQRPLRAFCFSQEVADELNGMDMVEAQVLPEPNEQALRLTLKTEYPSLR